MIFSALRSNLTHTLSVSAVLMLATVSIGCTEFSEDSKATTHGASIARVLGPALQDECSAGGVEFEYGIDTNGNGTLNDTEVQGAYTVCHGEAGKDGEPCNTQLNDDGSHTISCNNQEDIVLKNGEAGAVGPQGPAGPVGPPGAASETGSAGIEGEQGEPGIQGVAGLDALVSTVMVAPNEQCEIGGVKISSGVDINNNGSLDGDEITSSGYLCHAPRGEGGPQGVAGDTGVKGEIGPQGAKGEQGTKGDAGLEGKVGPQGIQGIKGSSGVQGPKGSTGSSGVQGPKGSTGSSGVQGPKGSTGSSGVQGPKGSTGSSGAIGPQGAQGVKGNTGATGSQGAQGPQGPQGPAGNSGANCSNGQAHGRVFSAGCGDCHDGTLLKQCLNGSIVTVLNSCQFNCGR